MVKLIKFYHVQTINLQNDSSYIGGAGSTIGTARVRHISRDAANYRYYLFDVQMNSGQNFRDVTSMGLDSQSWGNTILENGNAVIKEANNNNAFFDMSHDRPKSLTDISLTTQYMMHLGKDIHAHVHEDGELEFEKHKGSLLEGHVLFHVGINYKIADLWGKQK